MGTKKKILFVCHDELITFLVDIVDRLKEDYRIVFAHDDENIKKELVDADIVWFEWANTFNVDAIASITKTKEGRDLLEQKKTICRIHGYEVFAGMFKNIDYYHIDHVCFVSDHVRRIADDFFDGWNQGKRPIIINNGVDLKKFHFREVSTSKKIAIIADVNPKKNTAMWLEAAHQLRKIDPEYQILVAGNVQDIRCKIHLDQIIRDNHLGENIKHVGRIDNISKWLVDENISAILSTSIFESFGYGIAEAMAMGIKPIIYNYPGAGEVWPDEYVFNDMDQMIEILKKPMKSKEYRKWIEDKYSLDNQISEIKKILEGSNKYVAPTISACMIVKNEEEDIKKCLDSINDAVDEIIIVDTGSTDKTKEIVSEYKKVKLFDHIWKEDFSESRNVSIGKATGDWIMIIDADETLMPGDGLKIKALVDRPAHNGYLFQVYSALEHGSASVMNSERFFKNGLGTKYSSAIHNQISIGGTCVPTNIRIWHTGYSNVTERRKQRYENTLKILRKEINLDTKSVFHHFNLARQYTVMHRNEEGRMQSLHAIAMIRGRKTFTFKNHPYINIFHCLFVNCIALKDYITPEPYLIDIMEECPEYIDAVFGLSVLYANRGEEEKSLKTCESYLNLLNLHRRGKLGFSMEVFSIGYEAHIHYQLGGMYERKGMDEKARDHYKRTGVISNNVVKYKGEVIYEPPKSEIKKAS